MCGRHESVLCLVLQQSALIGPFPIDVSVNEWLLLDLSIMTYYALVSNDPRDLTLHTIMVLFRNLESLTSKEKESHKSHLNEENVDKERFNIFHGGHYDDVCCWQS